MEDAIRKQLQETGKFMMANGLAWGNAGNISARVSPDTCLISASGTFLGELGDDDLVLCSIPEARALSGTVKPSKELAMHAAVYQERPDIQAVLHASPLHSTLLACASEEPPSNLFVETMYYLERIARVPYAHPGSRTLAEEVRKRAASTNVLLLENHGVLVYDTSLKEARTALQTLEIASQMAMAARSAGIRLRGLPEETVRSFLTESGYRPVRKWGTS
jgi:L-fuculose-phosphate aldolase